MERRIQELRDTFGELSDTVAVLQSQVSANALQAAISGSAPAQAPAADGDAGAARPTSLDPALLAAAIEAALLPMLQPVYAKQSATEKELLALIGENRDRIEALHAKLAESEAAADARLARLTYGLAQIRKRIRTAANEQTALMLGVADEMMLKLRSAKEIANARALLDQIVKKEGLCRTDDPADMASARETLEATAVHDMAANQRDYAALLEKQKALEAQPNAAAEAEECEQQAWRLVSLLSYGAAAYRAGCAFAVRSQARARWTKSYVYVKGRLKRAVEEHHEFRDEMEKVRGSVDLWICDWEFAKKTIKFNNFNILLLSW